MDQGESGLVTKVRDLLDYAERNKLLVFEGVYDGGGDLPTFLWSKANPDAFKFVDFALRLGAKVLFYKVDFFTKRQFDECRWELDAVRDHLENMDLEEPHRKEYRSRIFEYLTRLNGFQEHIGEVGEIVLQVKSDGDLYEYVEDEEWYEAFTQLFDEIRSVHEELDEEGQDLDDDLNE
ncbi:MAG: hypothetical protein QXP58_01850 [Thermoprotei archaeon]